MLLIRYSDKDIFGLIDWDFMIVYLWSELLEGKWKFFFYYNKFFIEEFKKLDIEERERVFI